MGDTAKIDDKDEALAPADALDPGASRLEEEAAEDQKIWDEIEAEEAAEDSGGAPADEVISDDPADDTTQVETAADDEPDDIWAGASDAQRAAFDATQSRVTRLEHSQKSEQGRSKTLRRQLSDVIGQLDRAAVVKPPAAVDDDGNPVDDEPSSWDKLSEEYPEVATPVNDRMTKIEENQARILRQGEIEAEEAQEAHQNTVIEQTGLLEGQHKDWLAIATTPEFDSWLDDQPRIVRDAAMQNATEIVDATAAGDVITRYKASRSDQDANSDGPDISQDTTDSSLAARRKRQLNASRGARPRGPGTVVQGIPENGTHEEIWAAYDKLDALEAAKA